MRGSRLKRQSYRVIHFLREDGSDPIEEFLDSITDPKQQVSVTSNITRLEHSGLQLCDTHACKVFDSKKQLYELVKSSTRITFFACGSDFVLLHGFFKDTKKTERPDVRLTEERLIEYKRRGNQ